jgi:aryl-alcohol dehydrogenase-like predicted oxidoreductase
MPMDQSGRLQGGSRRYVLSAVEASLKRLQTDWIDLYQLHRPDPLTPIEETLRALEDLIRQGKVRYIGCSNLPAWQVAGAQWTAELRGLNAFISCQDEYSLVERAVEAELIPAATAYGMGLLPYFPLAGGLLTGKYKRNAPLPEGARLTKAQAQGQPNRFLTDSRIETAERLMDFAAQRGRGLLELAFSWLLAQPVVPSVIAGATKPEQVEANIKAADWALTADELAELDTITRN